MSTRRCRAGLAVLKDCRVFAVGGFNGSLRVRTVDMLDLSSPSPCWVPTVAMLARRGTLGVAVLDNCVYAVSYTEMFLFRKVNSRCFILYKIMHIYVNIIKGWWI